MTNTPGNLAIQQREVFQVALSSRRHAGIRLFLKGTNPLRGFFFDGTAEALNRGDEWQYDGTRLVGDYPPELHDELHAFAARLAAQVKDHEARGDEAFLRFSGVGKVGGASWSLPAVAACPLVDESCMDCYALAGFYHSNLAAQVGRVMRFEYLQRLMREGDLGPWKAWMIGALGGIRPGRLTGEKGVRFFRWHDSGDLFHRDYALAILDICHATPGVSHWLPTRVSPLLAAALASVDSFPANLSVTVSCARGSRHEQAQRAAVDAIRARHPAARVTLTYTDVQDRASQPDLGQLQRDYGKDMAVCPVTTYSSHSGSCEGCRRCWSAQAGPTVYVVQAPPSRGSGRG
jgi:hypothetical protein